MERYIKMSDTPITHEAVERWQQGKINIFDEMARLERERDTACRLLAQMHAAAVGEIQGPDIDPVTDILNLKKERNEPRGAMVAQDMREMAAGEKCGIPYHKHGCDWPDVVAEELLATRRELQLLLESTKVETCAEPLPERDGEPADFAGAITRMRLAEEERNQWREFAEGLVRCVRGEEKLRPLLFSADFKKALAEFDRLQEETK